MHGARSGPNLLPLLLTIRAAAAASPEASHEIRGVLLLLRSFRPLLPARPQLQAPLPRRTRHSAIAYRVPSRGPRAQQLHCCRNRREGGRTAACTGEAGNKRPQPVSTVILLVNRYKYRY